MSPAGRKRPGRPPTLYGKPFMAPGERPARMTVSEIPERYLFNPVPRGKTGAAHHFVSLLKEWSPMMYAFAIEQLRGPAAAREPRLTRLIEEWRRITGVRTRPSALELTAYAIERAFDGAWQIWRVKPPTKDADTFRRRYILGLRGALQDYREVVQEPRPWPRFHRGHLLIDMFLADKGEATKRYGLQARVEPKFTVITLLTEEDQVKLGRRPRRRGPSA